MDRRRRGKPDGLGDLAHSGGISSLGDALPDERGIRSAFAGPVSSRLDLPNRFHLSRRRAGPRSCRGSGFLARGLASPPPCLCRGRPAAGSPPLPRRENPCSAASPAAHTGDSCRSPDCRAPLGILRRADRRSSGLRRRDAHVLGAGRGSSSRCTRECSGAPRWRALTRGELRLRHDLAGNLAQVAVFVFACSCAGDLHATRSAGSSVRSASSASCSALTADILNNFLAGIWVRG